MGRITSTCLHSIRCSRSRSIREDICVCVFLCVLVFVYCLILPLQCIVFSARTLLFWGRHRRNQPYLRELPQHFHWWSSQFQWKSGRLSWWCLWLYLRCELGREWCKGFMPKSRCKRSVTTYKRYSSFHVPISATLLAYQLSTGPWEERIRCVTWALSRAIFLLHSNTYIPAACWLLSCCTNIAL